MTKTRIVEIERRAPIPGSQPYLQRFAFEQGTHTSILDVLNDLNSRHPLVDVEGNEAGIIIFERSCGVRKCGGCAMVINGVPRLACGTFVEQLDEGIITIGPLKKFPNLGDLLVEKRGIDEELAQLEIWLHGNAANTEKTRELRFESARCIRCGCCLEACPSYVPGGQFSGPLGIVNAYRILDQAGDKAQRKQFKALCRTKLLEGCSHSLSCEAVCPVGIPVSSLLARINR